MHCIKARESARETLSELDAALVVMTTSPAAMREHDAPNGWGTYEHALPFLVEWTEACRRYPELIIKVHA